MWTPLTVELKNNAHAFPSVSVRHLEAPSQTPRREVPLDQIPGT